MFKLESKYYTILVILFLFSFSVITAQEKIKEIPIGSIKFLSGDTLKFKFVEKDNIFITGFRQNKLTRKWKIRSYPVENILCYTDSIKISYLYNYKPSEGRFFSLDEMKSYVNGKKDALYGYIPKNKIAKSFLFGLFLGLIDTSFEFYTRKNGWQISDSFKGISRTNAGFISVAAPLASTFLVGKNSQNLMDRSLYEDEDIQQEIYNSGYENIKISKDTKAVARGCLAGVSFAVLLSLLKN